MHDWMYELRLFALEQLSAMRADLFLCDPHRIIVSGPTKLRGRHLDSRDIRSGMALIAAALAADGKSRGGPARDRRARVRGARRTPDVPRRAGRANWLAPPPPPGFFGGVTGTTEPGDVVIPGIVGWRGCGNAGTGAGCASGAIGPGSRGTCGTAGISDPRSSAPVRPRRNGLRSASDTSSVRTMCGVSVRMMSVCVDSLRLRANSRPTSGMSLRPGTPARTVRSSSRISPASMFVWPSFNRIVDVIWREANVGRPDVTPTPSPRCCSTRP